MRKLSLLAALSLATLGAAQSPLQTLTGGTNQGNVGGGIYFDLQVNSTVTIQRIDFLCGGNTVAGTGTLDIYLGPTTYQGNVTNPALWTLVASVSTAVAPSTVSNATLTTPFALGPGTYGVALKSNSFNHGYTNGLSCTSNTTPGSCSNSLFSNAEMTLRAGAAQNVFLSGGVFTPRIWNGAIHYVPGGTPVRVAAWEGYGQGCYAWYRSFYQLFPNPVGLNLGSGNAVTAIRLAFQGAGYQVSDVSATSSIVTPQSQPVALTSSDENFLASSVLPGGALPFQIPHPQGGGVGFATDLEISTEGYIVPTPATTPNDTTPAVSELLSLVPRWAPHWKNMAPLSGGSMHVEVNPSNQNELLVTWSSVFDNGYTTSSTFQVMFDNQGNVEYRYGAMSGNGGGSLPVIVGWSEGNNSLDPGNIEIATSLPFLTEPVDNLPLILESSARPLLNSSVNLVIDGIPTATTAGVVLLGFTQFDPGQSLAAIGMDGCFLYGNFVGTAPIVPTPPRTLFPLAIPNDPALNGGLIYGQTVTITPGFNPFGVLTSNGLQLTLGTL